MNTVTCNNLQEFESLAGHWDALWNASAVANPCARSSALMSAVEHFYSEEDFLAAVVFENGVAIAGIPLVKQTIKKFMVVYALPNNEWGNWGELLVHPDFDSPDTYLQLSSSITNATSKNFRLTNIDSQNRHWSNLLSAFESRAQKIADSFAFHVGLVQHDVSWQSYQDRLSKGFRKKLRKYKCGLEAAGDLSFEHHFRFDKSSLQQKVEAAFEVEQRSWKSEEASSVVASDQFEFFMQQARILADSEQLRISFLRLDDQIIAFEFGTIAKGVYFSWKIGFDADYAKHAPGQVLADYMTQSFHRQGDCKIQDTVGPISGATAKWTTAISTRRNVLIAGSSIAATAQFKLFQLASYWKSKLRIEAIEDTIPPAIGTKQNSSATDGTKARELASTVSQLL